ncbi:MAG: COG4315 family predicted lipoprotein [Acidimicrobiales bacterium]
MLWCHWVPYRKCMAVPSRNVLSRSSRHRRSVGRSQRRGSRLRKSLGIVVVAGVLVTGLSGCGGPASTARAVGPIYEVTTAQVGGLGTVLVDGKGFTLYLFAPDDHSSHSRCTGICAVVWPPLILPRGVASPLAGHGVKSSLLATTLRSDGSRQVTYNGWPLYLYVTDPAPGQATGQGLNNLGGLWYVVTPRGQPVRS